MGPAGDEEADPAPAMDAGAGMFVPGQASALTKALAPPQHAATAEASAAPAKGAQQQSGQQ